METYFYYLVRTFLIIVYPLRLINGKKSDKSIKLSIESGILGWNLRDKIKKDYTIHC